MPQPMKRPSSEFPVTNWQQIGDIQGGITQTRKRQVLGDLLRCYEPALKAHLIYLKRLSHHDAEEIYQGFVCDKVLAKNLVESADRKRGKFRTLLLTSLDNYLISVKRKENAQKRAKDRLRNVDDAEDLPDRRNTISGAFDVSWARQVLDLAINQMKTECKRDHHPQRWILFELCIRRPAFDGVKPPTYDDLIKKLGLRTRSEISNRLAATKRMFQKVLRDVIGQYAGDTDEIEEEIRDLFDILSQHQAAIEKSTGVRTRSRRRKTSVGDAEPTHTATDLAMLMSLGIPGPTVKSDDSLAAVWQELLEQPVEVVVLRKDPDSEQGLGVKTRRMKAQPSGNLLHNADPSPALLQKLKEGAKRARGSSTAGAMPKPIATLLYYACIAAGLARLNQRLTRMSDEKIQEGLAWCVSQPWLDSKTQKLCQEAIQMLNES